MLFCKGVPAPAVSDWQEQGSKTNFIWTPSRAATWAAARGSNGSSMASIKGSNESNKNSSVGSSKGSSKGSKSGRKGRNGSSRHSSKGSSRAAKQIVVTSAGQQQGAAAGAV